MLRRAVGLFRLKDYDHGPWKVCVSHSAPSPFFRSTSYFLYRYRYTRLRICRYVCGCLYHSPSTLYTVYYVYYIRYTYSPLVDNHIFYAEDFYYNNEWNRIDGVASAVAVAVEVGGDIRKERDDAHDYIYIYIILYWVYTCMCLYIGYSISIHKTRAIIKALYSNHQASGCLMTKQRIDNGSRVHNIIYVLYAVSVRASVYVCIIY